MIRPVGRLARRGRLRRRLAGRGRLRRRLAGRGRLRRRLGRSKLLGGNPIRAIGRRRA